MCLSSITCKGGKGIECLCPKKTYGAWDALIHPSQEEGTLSWASRGDNVLLQADHASIKKVKYQQYSGDETSAQKLRYIENKINPGHHGM